LGPAAAVQRVDVLKQYPDYDKLSKAAQQLQADLRRLPLTIDAKADPLAADEQKKKLAELGRISALQELLLRAMAVDRVFAPLIFPPMRSAKAIQESLTAEQALLIFFATTPSATAPARLYAFLVTKDKEKYPQWRVNSPSNVVTATQKLLRELGNYGDRRVVPLAQLVKSDWKTPALEIFRELFTPAAGSMETIPAKVEELVIVPD